MKKLFLPLMFSTFVISACSQSVPKCSDTETVDLVKEIASREIGGEFGPGHEQLISYDVKAIRTTDKNDKTGALECSAELMISSKQIGFSKSIPIKYLVELTDEGDEFYVTVFGI